MRSWPNPFRIAVGKVRMQDTFWSFPECFCWGSCKGRGASHQQNAPINVAHAGQALWKRERRLPFPIASHFRKIADKVSPGLVPLRQHVE
jgi:hypothetical protein